VRDASKYSPRAICSLAVASLGPRQPESSIAQAAIINIVK